MLFQGEKLNSIDIKCVVDSIFGANVHEKRKKSLTNAALGVINSVSLIVYRIGLGLAAVNDLFGKHAVKQVDRLLSNEKFSPWDYSAYYDVQFISCTSLYI